MFGLDFRKTDMPCKSLVMRTSMKCWQPKTCAQELKESGEQKRQSEVFKFTASVTCLKNENCEVEKQAKQECKSYIRNQLYPGDCF